MHRAKKSLSDTRMRCENCSLPSSLPVPSLHKLKHQYFTDIQCVADKYKMKKKKFYTEKL